MELKDFANKWGKSYEPSQSRFYDCSERLLDDLKAVKEYQPTQFKVATEDSPEVLVEPDNYSHYLDGFSCLKEFDKCTAYHKAPSISQDRLELNKLRVENKRLKEDGEILRKQMSENHKEYYSHSGELLVKLTEANKQLKEYKEVVFNMKRFFKDNSPMDMQMMFDTYLDESKLNKD